MQSILLNTCHILYTAALSYTSVEIIRLAKADATAWK